MDRLLKQARSSGSLNLSNRSLREVPNEVYKNLEVVGEDEKWWEGVELQKLILAHNELEVLREDVKNLTMLSILNISHNKLSSLPAAIGELSLLKSLDVSFNSLTCIPEDIGSLTSLVKLDCSNNLLNELPHSLGNCIDLMELKATNNSIAKLPDELAKCLKLIKVDIEGNKLTIIPENILRCWTILTEFNAAKNLLTTFPDSIGVLTKLIRLDFHQNKILLIPSSIMGCCSLAEFYMGTNMLSSLPEELGALSRLGTLDLHSNQLKEFPVEACKLQLSVLDLSNNSLSSLPPEIGNMTSLRKLLLNGNPIRTIRSSLVSGPTLALLKYLRSRLSSTAEAPGSSSSPIKVDVIAKATRLSLSSKELSLSGLGLTTVPSTVWETDEVVKVDLSRNSITELPNEMTTCSSLQVLILSGNKITQWPGVILSSLPSLSSLKLDNNPLSKVKCIWMLFLYGQNHVGMMGLQWYRGITSDVVLFPSPANKHPYQLRPLRMKLSHIPPSILSLQQLRVLDLSQNLLVSLPEDVRNLTCLQELNLSNNNIAALPSELGLLDPHLQVLKLDGNPLRSIRRPVLDRGTKAILKYLKDKLPEQ
ncbi:plant intracellular Ras-group-related LRR protein 6 [Dendrobium catenatum]|uniref:plant intracellular Ras-group-related LRR protein 6 n=1 Tax=Dendrobium catenatum TaxID=906689 RepID=UPI00109F4553|nr:plant intracellular Ras-group-related LRR protein 6 [Dendrobium catenatum]